MCPENSGADEQCRQDKDAANDVEQLAFDPRIADADLYDTLREGGGGAFLELEPFLMLEWKRGA